MIERQLDNIKLFLQRKGVNIIFPAQELWFNNNTLNFWAYDIENDNILVITNGEFKNNIIEYKTRRILTENIEDVLNHNLDNIINQGYTCYSMMI
jgi:hypothetical protein